MVPRESSETRKPVWPSNLYRIVVEILSLGLQMKRGQVQANPEADTGHKFSASVKYNVLVFIAS
jgi:hypothetical protein